jgi:hypothetical protein
VLRFYTGSEILSEYSSRHGIRPLNRAGVPRGVAENGSGYNTKDFEFFETKVDFRSLGAEFPVSWASVERSQRPDRNSRLARDQGEGLQNLLNSRKPCEACS